MADRRDPIRIRHAVFELVMARVSAIACGHKDAIDLDRLRHDPPKREASRVRLPSLDFVSPGLEWRVKKTLGQSRILDGAPEL